MLHIQVYAPFEEKFQEVENKRLQQIVAKENTELVVQQEIRFTQTANISAQAERNKRLQQAESDIVQVFTLSMCIATTMTVLFRLSCHKRKN